MSLSCIARISSVILIVWELHRYRHRVISLTSGQQSTTFTVVIGRINASLTPKFSGKPVILISNYIPVTIRENQYIILHKIEIIRNIKKNSRKFIEKLYLKIFQIYFKYFFYYHEYASNCQQFTLLFSNFQQIFV